MDIVVFFNFKTYHLISNYINLLKEIEFLKYKLIFSWVNSRAPRGDAIIRENREKYDYLFYYILKFIS